MILNLCAVIIRISQIIKTVYFILIHLTKIQQYSKQSIDYDSFYDFLRKLSENNIVLISEYNMPDDFKCIWQKERTVLQKSDRIAGEKAVEKLFEIRE